MKTKKNEWKQTTERTNALLGKNDYRQKLKTEICMWFQQGKECPKGFNCDFAHGISEL